MYLTKSAALGHNQQKLNFTDYWQIKISASTPLENPKSETKKVSIFTQIFNKQPKIKFINMLVSGET